MKASYIASQVRMVVVVVGATGSFYRVRKKQAVTPNYSLEKVNPIKLIDFKSSTPIDNRAISQQLVGVRSWAWPRKEHRVIAVSLGVLLSAPNAVAP